MTKVYTPDREYAGISAGIQFRGGVAEVDEASHPAAMAYFRRSGYGIGRRPGAIAEETGGSHQPVPPVVHRGTPLRDAAVDPMPGDFLPPINAGEADPHGPLVVSPEIHAAPTGPIRPGPVAVDDPDRQSAEETRLAEAVRVDQQDVGGATVAAAIEADAPDAPSIPGARATKAEWVDHAESRGIARDEAEDMTIAQIRERLGV